MLSVESKKNKEDLFSQNLQLQKKVIFKHIHKNSMPFLREIYTVIFGSVPGIGRLVGKTCQEVLSITIFLGV